ncbi:MAG TPA: TonB-dependent receptor [Agriterribacter sp.]|nr:TonB-dependent receptor [Chitinophagaceae bacterium]HRP32615.1 TonB-dependent receptor [Agriterribacter sp.]
MTKTTIVTKHPPRPALKALMLMNGIALLLLTLSLQVSAAGFAQRKISLEARNISLSEALRQIETQTVFRFVYSNDLLQGKLIKDINFSKAALPKVMELLLHNTSLGYKMINDSLISIGEQKTGIRYDKKMELALIKGKVTDENGKPLPGVSVLVVGSNRGTIADENGDFTIDAKPGETLEFSIVGYITHSVKVGSEAALNIKLQPDVADLSSVVVIGYGTQKKGDLTGAITSLKASDLSSGGTVSNAAQALQGRAAGVMVVQNSKAPGGSMSVRVRGANSISSTNEPLYVVDGFATTNGADLNPNDIESMEILKDASATAIYGARGANGVIIITTKRGKSGKAQITYNGYVGGQKVQNPFHMLNGKQYMTLANELYKEIDGQQNQEYGAYTQSQLQSNVNTDWIKEATRIGIVHNHNIQVQGGNENTKILTSVGYFDQQGVLKNTKYSRFSGRVNVDQKINSFIKSGATLYGQRSNSNIQDYSGNILQSNVLLGILGYDPTVPVYNADGTFGRPPGGRGDNPLANLLGRQNELVQDRFNGNAYLEIKPIPELTGRINGGVEIGHYSIGKYLPRSTYQGGIDGGVATASDYASTRQLFDGTLTYAKTFNDVHSLSVLGGYAYEKTYYSFRSLSAMGFSTDLFSFNNLDAASTISGSNYYKQENFLISFFGRVNYSYNDKYLLTFTLRRDGSSRFGADHRWGNFPSGAFAWRLDREDFIRDLNVFSNLKFRLGYGQTGNDQIGNYAAYALMATTRLTFDGNDNTAGTHLNQGAPENPSLKWETTSQYNAGLDMGFFNSRLMVSVDGYYKRTTDLLLNKSLPLYSGFSSGQVNLGAIENKGIEFEIASKNITGGKFTWDTKLNLAINRNKVLDIGGKDIYLTSSKPMGTVSEEQFAVIREGEPLGSLFGYVYMGVIQQGETYAPQPNSKPGDPKFQDISGADGKPDGKIDSKDRTIIGSANPKFIYGITNSLNYGNFDLGIFIHGSVGNDLLNMTRMNLEWNRTTESLNRWTPSNTNTDIPRNGFYYMKSGGYINSHFIEKASFMRLKNVTLGYTIQDVSKVFKSIRVYAALENMLTLTGYSGWDPEVDTKGYETTAGGVSGAGTAGGGQGANAGAGLDFNSYPAMRSYTFGFSINF